MAYNNESDSGNMKYFPKYQKCQCCHKVKKRNHFKQQYFDEFGEMVTHLMAVCNSCREEPRGDQSKHVDWGGRMNQGQAIDRPSIIDWMEQNAKN